MLALTSEPTGLEPPLSGSVFRCNSDRMRRSTSLLAQRTGQGRGFIRQDYPPAIQFLTESQLRLVSHGTNKKCRTSGVGNGKQPGGRHGSLFRNCGRTSRSRILVDQTGSTSRPQNRRNCLICSGDFTGTQSYDRPANRRFWAGKQFRFAIFRSPMGNYP